MKDEIYEELGLIQVEPNSVIPVHVLDDEEYIFLILEENENG